MVYEFRLQTAHEGLLWCIIKSYPLPDTDIRLSFFPSFNYGHQGEILYTSIAMVPECPKIYHIVHIDRLESILGDGFIWCDAEVRTRKSTGTTVGMPGIKDRRLSVNKVNCRQDLYVGDCTPFYFCPRSIMLYLLAKGNHSELTYTGGQEPILHLESDLCSAVDWANEMRLKWAFTDSNAGNSYFNSYCTLSKLEHIDWEAVKANDWKRPQIRERKQAEFLIENRFPWKLIRKIGVFNSTRAAQVSEMIGDSGHLPEVQIMPSWYY